jgi:hypothetical protein
MKADLMHIPNQKTLLRLLAALPVLTLVVALATGCGRPSYDLTVRVTDLEGNPLRGAMVGLHENGQTRLTDLEGQVTWTELDEAQASLAVVAQGYLLYTSVVSLERGTNETTLTLEKKPAVPYQPPDGP